MTTTYHFYSFAECLHIKNSKTATLYTALRTIEPDFPNIIPELIDARERGHRGMDFATRGLYCMYVDGTIVSVALLNDNILDRILTIPKFRRRGYAVHLIKHIAEQFVAHKCPFFLSPVEARIAPLFEKAGWVSSEVVSKRDGTIDYTIPEMLPLIARNAKVIWDRQKWSLHLFLLQTHLYKPKNNQPSNGSTT